MEFAEAEILPEKCCDCAEPDCGSCDCAMERWRPQRRDELLLRRRLKERALRRLEREIAGIDRELAALDGHDPR